MTPAARIQAAIEVLDALDAARKPAEAVLNQYLRARRYIGAKDRGAIAEIFYRVLRRYGRIGWWLDHLRAATTGRTRLIADLSLGEGMERGDVAQLFSGQKFGPPPLTEVERKLLFRLAGKPLDGDGMDGDVKLECPPWAAAGLRQVLGDRFVAEMTALLDQAPVDLRVNPLKADRDGVLAALKAEGIAARPTRLSPLGIRLTKRVSMVTHPLFTEGQIEIQDEGSQLVGLLARAEPGMRVVDFCAGAGGKSLVLAAAMANKGKIVACDVNKVRLEKAAQRLRRAGVHNAESRALVSERDPWVKRHAGGFDRVLVDAPCTGVGTWRRNPDARWGRGVPDLGELVGVQARILDSAARLVKPGGRLIYATCSLLPEENEAQIAALLAARSDFVALPIASLWQDVTAAPLPKGAGDHLRLLPGRDGTDGFFVAVLERQAARNDDLEGPE